MFSRYPLSWVGFDIVVIDEVDFGWGKIFSKSELVESNYVERLNEFWIKTGVFEKCSKAHINYVNLSLDVQGLHKFIGLEHPLKWNWDFCPHPNKYCASCDTLVVTSSPEKVNAKYYKTL
jgi:hypothetical protein